jgi:hypothetical protein
MVYHDAQSIPSNAALRKQPRWIKDEFESRMTFAREFLVDVDPDAAVFRDVNLKGLLLSTF